MVVPRAQNLVSCLSPRTSDPSAEAAFKAGHRSEIAAPDNCEPRLRPSSAPAPLILLLNLQHGLDRDSLPIMTLRRELPQIAILGENMHV